ncbi:competence protein ComA [Comamonas serinivorans]|uniref:Competence protein ComA n=1 Tax=Comamonas serinivorans TaxID=1082851 RepID=A0A1Y0EPW2_9BURK|nr:PaaI family thioesterase [Comamonas serinivorans]ARU05616.1 competence protein ComA [Comamonas serinivorans]
MSDETHPSREALVQRFQAAVKGTLPDFLGLVWDTVASGHVAGHFDIAPHHLAPNGYLHAASVIALADSACGFGCVASLPEGVVNFTTIELKSNFLGTAREGRVHCEARLVHGGRSTQLWDATVMAGDRTLALFRCTQMLLAPKPAR